MIGSGVAGMAVSIRLALRGYSVTVYEANEYVGGKLSEISTGNYRFDAGPSLFTMPQLLEDLFALAGKKFSDYCPYERLETITHYFYPDGTAFKSYADPNRFAEELESAIGADKQSVLNYLRDSHQLYDSTFEIFLNHSIHRFADLSWKDLLKAGKNLPNLNLFSTMHNVNARKLGSKKLVQYFDRYATYNGSDPYQCPGTLNVIPHLEHHLGAYFPRGGMIAITNALHQLATELGVRFSMQDKVEEILVRDKKVSGLRAVKTGDHEFDLVVSNMDVVPTYKKLLPKVKHPEKTLSQPRSSSALIFYWGIKREFPELGLHNIFFADDYEAEFRTLFQKRDVHHDPTVYINISSKNKTDDAPPGCENWFVMINTPNNEGQDWDSIIERSRRSVTDKLSRMLQTDIAPLIEAEAILDPRTIESRTSSFRGALYGSSSNNRMAAFLRHPNFSSEIQGLYFCGGSVHPGGGIPLCVLSAKITDEVIA